MLGINEYSKKYKFKIEEDLAKELFTLGSESYKRWFNNEESPLTNNPFIVGTLYENYLKPVFTVIVADGRDVPYSYYKLSSIQGAASELYKLLYGYLRLSFGKVFKAVILCSTPYVICAIIASLTGISFISLVGDILMIFYVNKCLTTYKIKYDGGIPVPGYIRKMTETKDEERGNDDNEL